MPYSPPVGNRIYRSLRFGRTVDLIVMDQRQYRADQPCNDAIAPACPDLFQGRAFLGQRQMDWVKNALRTSPAAWKVMANEVMMMPVKLPNDTFARFDSWQGYPVEREQLLQFIRTSGIADVVFITGDIHTVIAGDVRTDLGAGEPVAVEFVGGSITSRGIGEGQAGLLPGNDRNPRTDPALINLLRGLNPWTDNADLDHHGYARVTATQQRFDCEFVRMQTIKRRSRATLPSDGFRYSLSRGQRSIKGVHGPVA
jgi:alkaline phosphatase D